MTTDTVAIKREILALYDGGQEGSADGSRIHRFAELPLNHLGFIVRFHDVRVEMPDPASMERYRGVLTWFVGPIPNSRRYLAWAAQVSSGNVHYVVLGDVGASATPDNLFLINRVFGAIGLRHTGDYVSPTRGTIVTHRDPELIEHECRLDPVLPDYPVIETVSRGVRIGLALQVPARDGTSGTSLVAVGEKGGYAGYNYEFCHQRAPTHRGRWMIDPFVFFQAAFGGHPFPLPDVTTVSGRRVYFSQLHSEGWTSETKVERYRQPRAMAAEVVLRELIEPFADMPVTLDLRESDIVRSRRDARRAREIAEIALALPQIERPGRNVIGTILSRYDVLYPSISSLSPLAASGPERVYYTATGDETAYSEKQLHASTGLLALGETLRNTELPRRIKVYNLNYHVYAGQHPATLRAVRDHIEAARAAALIPVAANHYAEIVGGFFTTTIARSGPSTWRIANRGALQTVRFDSASDIEIDMAASVGVLGYTRHGGALYAALDHSIETAEVVVKPRPQSVPANGRADVLTLVESRWQIRSLVRKHCSVSFEAQGYGRGEFLWSAAGAADHRIIVSRQGQELWRHVATVARDNDRLSFVVPIEAIEPVTIEVTCSETIGQ